MALKPCRECDAEISTEGATCPHCGARTRRAGARRAAEGVLVVGILLSAATCMGTDSSSWTWFMLISAAIAAVIMVSNR